MKNIAYDIPFVNLAGSDRDFNKAVKDQLVTAGLSETQQMSVIADLQKQRLPRNIIEATALLGVSATGEGLGRAFVNTGFLKAGQEGVTFGVKESFATLVKKGGVTPFLKAGFYEGASSVAAQEVTRGTSLKASTNIAAPVNALTGKDYNLPVNNILLGGTFGAASASLIGGVGVLSTSIKYPKVSKGLQIFSYLTDYNEFAGDKLRDLQEYGGKRVLGRSYPEPKLYANAAKNADLFGFDTTTDLGKAGMKPRAPVNSNLVMNVFNQAGSNNNIAFGNNVNQDVFMGLFTNVNTETQANVKTGVNTNVAINTAQRQKTPVNTNIFTNIPVNTKNNVPINTNIDLLTNTNVNVNPNEPVDTQINTPVNTNIFSDVPVTVLTPIARLPTPLPLEFPGMGGFGGGQGRSGKKYVNEIAAGGALLNDLLGSKFDEGRKALRGNKKGLTKSEKKEAIKQYKNNQRRSTGGLFKKLTR